MPPAAVFLQLIENVERVLFGKRAAVETVVAALLAPGSDGGAMVTWTGDPSSGFAPPAVADAQRTWRARGRLLFAIAYAAMISIAVFVASAVPEPAVFGRAAIVFAALQPAFLLIAGAMADVRLALVNALALVVLAALRGGPVAALAAIVAFVLIALFLLADNAMRILDAYAARRGPQIALALREGASVIAPLTAGLALILWIAPPQPWAGVRWTSGPPRDLPKQVYALVFFASLIGAGAVGLAARRPPRRGGG